MKTKADQLAKTLQLKTDTTTIDNINRLLGLQKYNRATRISYLENIRTKDPASYDVLKFISDDLDNVIDLVSEIVDTQVENPVVDFNPPSGLDPMYQGDYTEEFISLSLETGELGVLGWSISGTGAVIVLPGESLHPGLIQIQSPGAAGTQRIYLGGIAAETILLPTDVSRMTALVRMPVAQAAIKFRFGLENDFAVNGAGITDGIYFEYSDARGANWFAVNRLAAVETATDSLIPMVVNDWFKLELFKLDDDDWDFYINDEIIAESITNLPNAVNMNIGFACETTAAAVKDFDIDYFRFQGIEYLYNDRWT